MTKLPQPLTFRAALLALALLLASFAIVSRPAEAVSSGCQGFQGATTYYSDSTYRTIVSTYFSSCQGVCTGSGPITKWWRFDHFVCTD
jgi:hypothetical protein